MEFLLGNRVNMKLIGVSLVAALAIIVLILAHKVDELEWSRTTMMQIIVCQEFEEGPCLTEVK